MQHSNGEPIAALDTSLGSISAIRPKKLKFGFVLLPNFTLTAFSGFVDMLRLTADEGDFSKPVRCSWTVIGENLLPIRSSCGVQITPWERFDNPDQYDYIVVVGGLLHSGPQMSDTVMRFIQLAAKSSATLVGICTGTFALMRAGVMKGYRCCVSWYHYWDFVDQFPAAASETLIADRLFVVDRERITCAGGRASIDVAASILYQHFDTSLVRKSLRILMLDEHHRGDAPQPNPPGSEPVTHPKVKRAILLMEQNLSKPLSVEDLAEKVNLSQRQFERLFKTSTGQSPQNYAKMMRLRTACWMLTHTKKSVSSIASDCGFSDSSHLGRDFRRTYKVTPSQFRQSPALLQLQASPNEDPHYEEVFPGRQEFY